MRVWKYELPTQGTAELWMPVGAIPRAVGWQAGLLDPELMLWAEVDPTAGTIIRRVHVVTTGHIDVPGGAYVGTAQLVGIGGQYVVHVYIEE